MHDEMSELKKWAAAYRDTVDNRWKDIADSAAVIMPAVDIDRPGPSTSGWNGMAQSMRSDIEGRIMYCIGEIGKYPHSDICQIYHAMSGTGCLGERQMLREISEMSLGISDLSGSDLMHLYGAISDVAGSYYRAYDSDDDSQM